MSDMSDVLANQAAAIDRRGWALTGVFPTVDDPDPQPPFVYTIGLTEHGHPEFIITGLGPDTAGHLLNDIAGRVYDRAETFTHGQRVADLIDGYDVVVVEGEPPDGLRPGMAYARYGVDRVRLLQVVWPDNEGRYPWDDRFFLGYSPHGELRQPTIGTPS